MAFDFYMPDIGEGVVEGEIVAWRVKVGDKVKLDQPIVEVMTDKATVELPSPRAGTIAKINYKDGDICPVGKVLVVIDEEGGAATASPPPAHGKRENGHGKPAEPARAPQAHAQTAAPSAGGGIQVVDATENRTRVLATPATRRLARQLGVEIGRVPATGKHGRVTSDDVKRFQGNGSAAPAAQGARAGYAPIAIAKPAAGYEEERVPLRGMRKRIAESMARSKSTAAHFTYVEEIDMTELVAVRDRARSRAAERGVKLNYLPFIVKAVVSGLKKWPQLNASLDETTQEIVRKKYYHVGIAAQGPQGLVVTVVRDADKRSIFDLSREIDRLGEAVRTNTATREELTGSTFTISSLGKLGGVLATPIINFPEVAILGVHKIEERPAVRNGQIVARHLMNLSISVDHRLADGWDGAMFLQDVKSLLEDPTTMFMEMV
ncbi:MAG TPA: dihydrolipoamide acetyltransferase family protein [Kofleriaceae bacterium]|nr:dihydrolipoamide acetyltransferase family protein [Kofleriaceae bacterium]